MKDVLSRLGLVKLTLERNASDNDPAGKGA
jgi:hypothetical protein